MPPDCRKEGTLKKIPLCWGRPGLCAVCGSPEHQDRRLILPRRASPIPAALLITPALNLASTLSVPGSPLLYFGWPHFLRHHFFQEDDCHPASPIAEPPTFPYPSFLRGPWCRAARVSPDPWWSCVVMAGAATNPGKIVQNISGDGLQV